MRDGQRLCVYMSVEVPPRPHRGGAVWDRVIDRHVEVLVFSDVMVYVAHHLPHPCAIEIPSNNVAPPPPTSGSYVVCAFPAKTPFRLAHVPRRVGLDWVGLVGFV